MDLRGSGGGRSGPKRWRRGWDMGGMIGLVEVKGGREGEDV